MPETEVIAMTNVIPLRPRRRPHRPAARPVPVLVSVEWDEARGLYAMACERCCESATTHRLEDADAWAETHRCDPELAALLAAVLSGTAA
jgi:hypothetical protein